MTNIHAVRPFFMAAFVLFAASIFAQKHWPEDSLRVSELLKTAHIFIGKGDFKQAETSMNDGFALLKKNDELDWWLFFNGEFADLLNEANQPFLAIDFVEKAAKHPFRPCQSFADWKKMAYLRNVQEFYAEQSIGDYTLAKKYLDQAEQIWRNHLPNDSKTGIYILNRLGNIYTRLGDYERAKQILTECFNLAIKTKNSEKAKVASDLSLPFRWSNDLPNAIKTVNEALALPDLEAVSEGYLLQNLVEYYHLANEPKLAQRAYEKGLRLLPKMKDETERASFQADLFQAQGQSLKAQKRWPEAEEMFQKALFWLKKVFENEERREFGKLHIELGQAFLGQKKAEKALAEFQKALHCVVPKFDETDPAHNPDASFFYPENTIEEALGGKAEAWRAKFEKTGKTEFLEHALACHEAIQIVENELRETYQFESSSLQSLDESRSILEHAADIAHLLFEKTGQRDFAEKAFLFAEKSKGLLLLKELQKAKMGFALPDELRQTEQDLNGKMAYFSKQIFQEKNADQPNAAYLAELNSSLAQTASALEKFKNDLKKQAPDYLNLLKKEGMIRADGVPNLLRDGQAMVEYLVGDSFLFVFWFEKTGAFSMRKTSIPTDFNNDLIEIRQFLDTTENTTEKRNRFVERASKLFELLLAPELRASKIAPTSLVVVPDGLLGFLPFELLIDSKKQIPQAFGWAELPFLLKNCTISYAYSANLLAEQQAKRPTEGLKLLAGFAPSYPTDFNPKTAALKKQKMAERGSDGSVLLGAQAEIDSLRAIVGGDFFIGSAAEKTAFLRLAGQYRILHLAMHAQSDNENPGFSRLIFSPKKDDSSAANFLYANELQQILLHADFAVLSACNTGNGRLYRGEGVFSLARAFALAGVPSTMMSLWPLNDEAAPELMTVFYRKLKAGLPKDEALRAAKLAYLESDTHFKHPHFWAGLVVNGQMASLDLSEKPRFSWWTASFLGLAVVFGWFAVRRRRQSHIEKTTFAVG